MNTVDTVEASSAGAAPQTRLVLDAATRAFHWLLALCFAGAWLTAEEDGWRVVHASLGYTVLGLLVFRLIWGFVGPRHARWSALFGRLRGLPAWARSAVAGNLQPAQGYAALNAAAVAAIVVLLALTVGSGVAGYNLAQTESTADVFGEVHEVVGNVVLFIVFAHIAMVLGGWLLLKNNRLQAMLTGRVAGRGPDLVQRSHRGLAALLVVAVASFWAFQFGAGDARIGTEGPGAKAAFHKHGEGRGHGGGHSDHDDDD